MPSKPCRPPSPAKQGTPRRRGWKTECKSQALCENSRLQRHIRCSGYRGRFPRPWRSVQSSGTRSGVGTRSGAMGWNRRWCVLDSRGFRGCSRRWGRMWMSRSVGWGCRWWGTRWEREKRGIGEQSLRGGRVGSTSMSFDICQISFLGEGWRNKRWEGTSWECAVREVVRRCSKTEKARIKRHY